MVTEISFVAMLEDKIKNIKTKLQQEGYDLNGNVKRIPTTNDRRN